MKTSLAARLEELIENTSDKQFDKIYKDLIDYKKKHYIEYNLAKNISIMDDLNNIIIEQQIFRNKLKKKSIVLSSVQEEEEKEDEQETFVENNEEPWESWWRKKSPSKPVSFARAFAYVVGIHICVIGYVGVYSIFKSPSKPTTNIQKSSTAGTNVTPDTPKYVVMGPRSDAIGRR